MTQLDSMNHSLIQKQVDEVTLIMKHTMEKVMDRDEKLSNLDEKSNMLLNNSKKFGVTAIKLKRKMLWKNIKCMMVMVSIVLVFAVLLALIIWSRTK